VKCGLETTPVTADASAESAVRRSQATRQCLPVSVLDLVATRAGEAAGSAIAQTVELARQVEQLGYKRYGGRNVTPCRDWLAQPRRC